MTATMAASATAAPPPVSWDEQVVPALRKRLQAESVVLTRRMSYTRSPEDGYAEANGTAQHLVEAGHGAAHLGPAVPIAIIPSTPTPSSSTFPAHTAPSDLAQPSPPISRIPLPCATRSGSTSSASSLAGDARGRQGTRPRARSRSGSTAGSGYVSVSSTSGIPVPVRARTKSSPAPPEGMARSRSGSGSGSGEGVPAVPHGTASRLSPGTGGGGGRLRVARAGSDESSTSVGSASSRSSGAGSQRGPPIQQPHEDRSARQRRSTDSLDLATSLSRSLPASTTASRAVGSRANGHPPIDTAPIRDELPPFVLDRAGAGGRDWDQRVGRDEALRIAQTGCDLEGRGPGSTMAVPTGGTGEPRRRTESTLGRNASRRALPGQSVQAVIEAAKGGGGVSGLLQPTSLRPLAAMARGSPRNGKASSSPTTSHAPNSVSMNDFGRLVNASPAQSSSGTGSIPTSSSLRSLSARDRDAARTKELPPAAFMIPRIDEWTPPKGTNWDEVVLPAVAKKLGIGVSPEMQVDVWGRKAGEDGELPTRIRTRGIDGLPGGQDTGYDDFLDAYHNDDGTHDNTLDARAALPGSGTPLGSPIEVGANPSGSASGSDCLPHSLKHQPSTESGRFGAKRKQGSLRQQASSQSIQMQRLRHQQSSLGGQGGMAQLSVTGKGTAQADFPPPPKEHAVASRKTKAKDGHGKGCGCTIM